MSEDPEYDHGLDLEIKAARETHADYHEGPIGECLFPPCDGFVWDDEKGGGS